MRGVALAFVVTVSGLAGCLSGAERTDLALADPLASWYTDLEDVVWDVAGNYSKPIVKGTLEVLPVELVNLQAHDGVRITTAVWRPKVAEGVQVPVILDIGPYYEDLIATINPNGREGEFFLDNFVKNGFAYGRVAIRGTSASGGCMEFFSLNEQKDVDLAVTHFGTQPWSNGNVGLYGASYDGTTPWIAAQFGNPHLKTIVPVSGLSDVAELMYRNGTAESRGIYMHSYVYWPFGFGLDYSTSPPDARVYRTPQDWRENLCQEAVRGGVSNPYTAATGDRAGTNMWAGYWAERNFQPKVLENYNGSVYLVHGLQDWNVEGSMAYPFVNELEAKGLEVKHMLGQWGHDWPDRASREDHIRWDWAEILLRWFDRHLRENADQPMGPAADIEDNYGLWRTEETWPPRDANWTTFHLGGGALATEPTAPGSATLFNPNQAFGRPSTNGQSGVTVSTTPAAQAGRTEVRFELPRSEEELRFAGLARLHVTVTPHVSTGGHLYAEILDIGRGGQVVRAAHAVMDLEYYDGGTTRRPLQAGQPVVAKMEFFPADVLVPAGHRLVLRIVPDTAVDGMHPSYTPGPMTISWGDSASVLKLPVIERDVGDGTYPGQPRPI